MLTEMKLDYVRTAYSKGCSKNQVMFGHVLKNAMMPVITFLGMMIAEILAGSIVVEQCVCTAWDRQASDQFGRNKRPSGCGDFDFIYYLCGDFCLFYRGYSLPGDRSENP